jgi:hypothetical protein
MCPPKPPIGIIVSLLPAGVRDARRPGKWRLIAKPDRHSEKHQEFQAARGLYGTITEGTSESRLSWAKT